MKCDKGICVNCEEVIAAPCDKCGGDFQPTSKYTTVQLEWSNKSKMTFPVCIECSRGPIWEADKTKLTQAVFDAWDKEGHKYDKAVVLV